MPATLKGMENLNRFLASLPANLEQHVLRPAVKAGAEVIAELAREGCKSTAVRGSIRTSTAIEPGIITARVESRGKGSYLAPWLEYGTDSHLISVDESQSGGRTVRRINWTERETKAGSLMIGGKFVGGTVQHPGAKPYPFMRPALDNGKAAAVAAIGAHIASKLSPAGIATPAPADDDE